MNFGVNFEVSSEVNFWSLADLLEADSSATDWTCALGNLFVW